jgi:hypothetical protein
MVRIRHGAPLPSESHCTACRLGPGSHDDKASGCSCQKQSRQGATSHHVAHRVGVALHTRFARHELRHPYQAAAHWRSRCRLGDVAPRGWAAMRRLLVSTAHRPRAPCLSAWTALQALSHWWIAAPAAAVAALFWMQARRRRDRIAEWVPRCVGRTGSAGAVQAGPAGRQGRLQCADRWRRLLRHLHGS